MARTNIIKKVPHIMAFWRQNPKFFIGSILIICILFLSLGAPLFTSYDPAARIGESHEPPTKEHVLGTTHLGRDVFAQTIYGGELLLWLVSLQERLPRLSRWSLELPPAISKDT